jgi:uncharacterized repeat protein (TIGR01451 family)
MSVSFNGADARSAALSCPALRSRDPLPHRSRSTPFRLIAAAAALVLSLPASAQIQRSFVNLSFEQPAAAANCYYIVGGDAINGWSSTHPAPGTNTYCAPNITAATPGVTTGGQIEIWSGGFNSVTSLAGSQHAELNASASSRLFQTVCMINGESVAFTLGHRGRSSNTTADVAELNIDSAANSVVRASTSANAVGGVTQCGSTTVAATNGPVNGANDGTISSPSCSSATAGNGWRRYTGTFTFTGTTGNHSVGFESISTAGGDNTVGNFLDDIDITLKPVLELTSATFTTREGQPTTAPTITVVGTVPAGGLPLTINVAAGTATLGTDFTANTTFTIPAGNYSTPTAIPLTGVLTVLDDTVVEDNETINLTVGTSTGYVLSSTTTCNASAQATATVIILDNDVDVRTTKSVSNANPPAGGTTTFTVTFRNHTARPTVGTGTALNAHDATATLADALPTGFTAFSWTCAASGSPAPTCPAASGTGAINAAATLPAGNGAAAGGTLTYTITGTVDPAQCASTTNTASATLTGVFAEGTSAQAGFNTPAPGGTANNSESVAVDPGCLTLTKTTQGGNGGAFSFTLTNTSQTSGTATTVTAGTPVQVDGNAAAGTQPYGVAAANTAITINETALPAGFQLASATCISGVTAVGSLSGSTYTIPAASVTPGADFICGYTNNRVGSVTITKTLAPTTDTGLFTLSVNGTPVATNVGNSGSGSQANVLTGSSVTVAEAAGTGTTLGDYIPAWNCGAAGTGSGTSFTFTMPAGNVSCTVTNTRRPRVTITKVSNGGVGTFSFSGTNGVATHGITTVTPGTGVAGATQALTAPATATTLTEAAPSGFTLASISCTGLGSGGTATPNLGTRSVALNAAATAAGANIACTFTNTALVDLSITKTATPNGTYLPGQAISYTIVVTNTGPVAVSGVSITDTVPASITGTTWTCTAPAGSDCDTTAAGTGATGSGNSIALNNVALAAGAAATVTVNGTVANATTGNIVNTATATPPTGATCTTAPCTRTATATNTNSGTPQLSVAKTATPSTFAIGQAGTYSIQVSNTGTTSTSGTITVTDPMPANIVITATPSGTGWNCAASTTTNVSCTTTTVLPPGANAPVISVPVMVNAGAAQPSINTATVSGGGDATCPAATHCTGSVTTPINAPRLDLVKTLQGNLIVGVQTNYVLTVTNNGLADSLAGTITDTVPNGLTLGVLPAGCSNAGQIVTCQIPAGLSVGASVSYTIPITPQASISGQSVSNNAVVNGGGDPSCPAAAHCHGTTTDTVDSPQLTLAKSAPASFVVGVQSTYTLTLTNTGTAATTATTTITDTIPGGLVIGTPPAGCTAAGQVVTCTVAAGLATGTPVSFAIPVTPNASLNGLSVTNTATAAGGGDPSCPTGGPFAARCQPSVTTPVNAARLDIVKTASGNFVVGVQGSYTLTVTNNGTAATSASASINDVIPGDLVIGTLPAGCTRTGQTVTCAIASGLASGSSISFVIPVTPTAAAIGMNLSNTASVSGGGDPTCPGQPHCSSTTTTPVDAPALSIDKSAIGANFVVGVPASYTLTVTNTGTAATTAATTITDNVPATLTLGVLPAGCTAAGNLVTCTIPVGLATGTPVSFVIPVTPTAAANGTTLTNTATATGGGDPTCPAAARCTDTTTTPVQAPRLTIVKSASGNFVVGVPGSYTLTVTNNGTAATTAITTITDNVPATLTLGTLPGGCTATGNNVTCTIPAGLATGTPVSFVIPVTPTAAASGQTLANTATITGGGDPACPGDASCTSTINTPVNAPALTIVKTASAANFVVGVPASYTLTVTNNGSAATTATATISDTVPANLTLGAIPAGCTSAGQTVTCTIPAGLATGASATFVIPVTPTATASGTTLVNTATASGGGDPTCPAATRCTSTITTPVQAPRLTITKTANPTNFVVGVAATYTLSVENTGTAATTATATVSDTLPANLTPGTMPAGCTIAGQVVTCTIPAGLAPGATASFAIPVTATAAAIGTTLTNTATVSGGGDPTCPSATHCSSTVTTPVQAPRLDINKTSPSTFLVGVQSIYTLTITNSGTVATTAAATVSDTVPAGLVITATPAGCTTAGPAVTCTIPAGLAAGASTSFTIPVMPLASAAGTTLTNTATVSGGGDPTCPAAAHCTSTINTPVVLLADLTITKTATPNGTYLPGQAISYTITVTNNGPSAVNNVHVTDPLPAAINGATWTCTATNGNCATPSGAGSIDAFVNLGAGGSATYVVNGTVDIATTGNLVNTATAELPPGATCSTPPCTRTATVTNTDAGSPQLSVTKTATPSTFAIGQAGTYSIQVSNTGTTSTSGTITVTDPMPANIVITATPSGTGWNCAASTATTVSCTTTTVLPPGANAPVISVPVMVNAGAAQPSINTATVSGGGDATCPAAAHCQGSVTTPINAPRLDLVKTLQGNLIVGVQTNYVLTVTNNGLADSLAGTITDTVPDGLTLGVLPAGCSSAGQVVTCQIPAGLSVGASVSYTIPITPQASITGQSVSNNAVVNGGGDPSCPAAAHCHGTTTDTVDSPQLTLAKSAPASFVVGVQSTYTLTLTNTGTAATTAVTTITDTIPGGLTLGTPPAGCTAAGQVVTCTVPAGLATGAPVTFAIPVTPDASVNGLSVTNTATAAGGGDPSCPTGGPFAARCTPSVTTPVNAARLDIVKTASGNFVVGVQGTYTLLVTNNGTAATSAAATVTDVIPGDLVIGTLPAGCTRTGQTVTCTIPAGLANGFSASFVIPVTPTGAAVGQTLSNTATVNGGGDPSCPGQPHCSSTTTTPVDAPALQIEKSASGSSFVVGVPASYTLTVTNIGTAATTAVTTITDNVPGTLTLGTLTAPCTATGNTVTCTIPAGFATGTPLSFLIPVTATAAANGTTLSNTATVNGGGDPTCPSAARCSDTELTPVQAPRLTITKTASGNFVVGVPGSYTLSVINNGTAPTTAATTITDNVPASLTLGVLPAGCTASGNLVTCTIPAGLATGTPVSFVIPVTPTPAANGQTLANTATITGGGDPGCPGDASCTSTTNTPVSAPALTLTKTASAPNFVVGVPASYTLSVTNTGTAATTATATITDTIPTNLTLGAIPAGCTNAGQTVTCTIPAGLATGASATFVIPVTPTAAANGTTLVNTATASGGGDPACPAAARCTSTVNTPVQAAQLTIVKTASAPNFIVGVPASYTLTVENTGTAATTAAATVSDTVPGTLTLGAMPAGCTAAGNVVTCTIPAGFAPGAVTSFVIPVTPTPAANGTTLTNTATVSGGGDPTCPGAGHCTSTTTTPTNAPRLDIVKTASAANFIVGVPASYTLTVTNNGTAATTAAATISDTVPGSLVVGTPPAGCTAAGQTVTCTIAAGFAAGASTSFTIPVTPLPAAAGTTLTNTATVSGGGDPTCPAAAHCTSSVDVPVALVADLAITKTATPNGTYLPGQAISYTITVVNNGPSPVANVHVTDPLPAAITGATWTCTATNGSCDFASGSGSIDEFVSLAAGGSATFTINGTVDIAATGNLVNTATAEPPAGATCTTPPCTRTSTVTNTDAGSPQLSVTKTATPSTFAIGQAGTYSIQVSNTGTSSTSGTITLNDPVPANIVITATPSGTGWNCAASTATTVSCTTSTVLPPGANAPVISVPVMVNAGAAQPSINTATVSGGGDATCPAAAHCQGSVTTPINAPRLDLVKTLQGNLIVGVQTNYVLTVTNNGLADSLAGTITDTVPNGLTIGVLPAGCTSTGQNVTCQIPAGLAVGASVSYSIPITPQASISGQSVSNNASVNGGGDPSCPGAAHCSGTTTDTVDAPQLTLAKSATPATFVVGVQATYTLTLTNTGTAATTAVTTITDTIPGGLAIGTPPAGCSVAGQVVTCTVPAGLATGTPVSFAIPVTPDASVNGLSVTNTATASGGGDPSCPAGGPFATRCQPSVTTPVNAARLDIVKTASGNFVVGIEGSYTLTVTNNGTAATSAAATVTDVIPGDLVIGTLPAGCTRTGQTVTCSIPAGLASGASVSFVIPVTPTAAAIGMNLSNTASVTGGGDPSCPGQPHCSSTTTTPVDAPALSIEKTASGSNFVVGVPASYTLTVTNTGTAATTAAATITDNVPNTLTLGAMPAGCTAAGNTVTCTIPAGLATGAPVSFVIPVTPTAAANGQTLTNTASITGGGDPTCPAAARCSDTTTTPVQAPRLTIVKSASGNFVVGVPGSYTLTVTNNGTAATTAVTTITDNVPATLTLGALPAGCTATGNAVTCTIPAGLATGTPVSFVIPVTPTPAANGQTLSNTATITGGGDPGCPGDASCTSTTTTPVDAPALTIVKTASAANFVVGIPASYTLTVTNNGTAATTAAATISDTVPANLTIGTPPAGCTVAGQTVTCTIAAGLATGASANFTIPVTPLPAASGQTLSNTATVSGGGDPTCPAATRCTSTVTTPVQAPQLTITKTANPTNFVVGVAATYTLSVENTGTAATTATAAVSDTLPANLTPGTMPAGCTIAGQVVTCTIPASLAPGATASFAIPVTATPAAIGTTLTNTATVSGGGDPTCPGATHCSSTITTPVQAPRLDVTKTPSTSTLTVGVPATYTITVTNSGAAATTATATISDTVPATLALGAMPAGCTAAGQVVTCTIPAGLAAGASTSFTLPVTPLPAANGQTVVNTATVSGGGDPTCPADAHCTGTATTPVVAPRLDLTKTANPTTFVVGVPANYVLTATNNGTAATTAAATITDTLPANLTPGTMPAGCTIAGSTVTCTIPAGLAVGANASFTIPVTATAAAANSTLTNSASVTGGGDPSCPGAVHCDATVDVPVDVVADLVVTKTATPNGTYLPGQAISYTIGVVNNGPSPLTGVAIVDTVPAIVTVSGWTCTATGPGADCDTNAAGTGATGTSNAISLPNVALAAGDSVAIVVTGTVDLSATGTITNTVTATPPATATCTTPPCARSATVTNSDSGAPQLAVTKTATPTTFAVGQPATYTLQVSNTGTSSTSAAIAISDALPAGITASGTPTGTGWNCSASTATNVACTSNVVLLPGSNAPPISVPVAIAPGTPSPAVNTATASGGGDATCPAAAHCAGSVTTPINAPRLDVTKTLTGNFVVGVQTTYVITVTNNGQADTLAGTLTDTIPNGLTLGILPAECTSSGQTVTCAIAAGVSPGNALTFTIPVTPQASVDGQNLTNSATASGGGDATCPADAHCTGTTSNTVSAPQLSITKTAQPSTFVVGVPATYRLSVTNNGTAATTAAATVTDTLPGGLVIGTLPANCTAAGQTVTCTIAAGLATGTPVSFDIPVTPQASLSGLSVTNDATVAGGGDPGCPAGGPFATRCEASVTTPVSAAQLTLVKTANPTNFVVGVTGNYVLTVTNTGSAATTADANIVDTIPADLVIGTLPAGCTASAQTVTCTIPAGLAVGAPVSFTIPVTPTAAANGQQLVNTATVNGGGDPSCPGGAHCTSTVTTPVDAPALTIVKTASASSFVVGVPATYTLTVTNTGSAATTQTATVSDTVPGNLSIGSVPADCTVAGQVVTCTIAAGLATNTPVAFAIAVTPLPAANGTTLANTTTVSGGGDPGCPGATRCTSTVTTPVNAPRMTIVKTANPSNFVVGQPANYTLTVTNTGNAATTAVTTVVDVIPANLNIGTLPPDCTAAGTQITCTIAAGLATNTPVVFTIPVTPTAAASGSTLTNTATVSGGGDTACPGAATCTSTVDTPVNAPQLTLVKTASGGVFVVGAAASYTLTVTNTGNAATTAPATVSDTIASTLVIGTLPAGCTAAGQTVTCTIPAGLATNSPVSFVIPVTPTAAASGTTVANTATVSRGGDPTCPAAAHCTGRIDVPVDAPQLDVVKTASANAFVVGQSASYTIVVTNTGSAATTAAATVTDNVPGTLTLGTVPAGCTASGQQVTCTIAAGLAPNASASFTLTVTPTAAASGTSVVNTASVSGGGDPTCPAATHCSGSVTVPVDAPQLTIVKTASAGVFVVGTPASYTLTVTNTGNAATTQAATVTDNVPGALTLGAMPAGCTASGQQVTCTIAAGLVSNASVSFTLPVTPTPAASGNVLVNIAQVTGGGDPSCPQEAHCQSDTATPVDAPLLNITKTASVSNFTVGEAASYTITVTNAGSAATTATASVTDPVSASLTIGAMPAGCTVTGQSVTCVIPAGLAAGASVSFVIPVTPNATAGGIVTNTATVTGGGDSSCPQATHCSSTVDVPVGEAADLSIVKDDGNATAAPGGQIAYTLTVTNAGPSAASNVTVTDAFPASLTYVSASGNGWTCAAQGTTLTCTRPTLANAATGVINLVLAVPASYAGPNPIVNTANVSSPTTDPNPNNNSGSIPTPLGTGSADLSVTKTDNGASVRQGDRVTYHVTVTNAGPSDAINVRVDDPTPPGLTFVSASAPCAGGFPCTLGTLAAGASITLDVVYQVPLNFTSTLTITNTATATSDTPDPNPANNSGSDTTPVFRATDVVPVPGLGVFGLMMLAFGLVVAGAVRQRKRAGLG